jgi:hypothetical protein
MRLECYVLFSYCIHAVISTKKEEGGRKYKYDECIAWFEFYIAAPRIG